MKSGTVGLLTGVIMSVVGAAVVFAVTQTSFVQETSLAAVATASVVGGWVAWRHDAKASDPASSTHVVASMCIGVLTGLAFIIVIFAVIMIVGMVSLEHSNFTW